MQDSDVSVPGVPGVIVPGPDDDAAWVAEAYASYADGLYAYCRSLVREPAAAADAVRDTFVVLAFRLADLPGEGLLRPWLYAVARNECLRAINSGTATVAVDVLPRETGPDLEFQLALVPVAGAEGAGVLDDGAPDEADSSQVLVAAAVGGLAAQERDVMLMVWHGLGVAECAEVLAISWDEASRMFFRAREQLEASVGVLAVAHSDWRDCVPFRTMLAGWDGRLTPALRARSRKHIDRCDLCADQRRRNLTPAVLLSLAPEALRGSGATASASRLTAWVTGRLREQVLATAFGTEPQLFEYRAMVVRRAGPFRDDNGFPVALLPPGAVPRRKRSLPPVLLAAAAAVLVVIVGAGGVAFKLSGDHSNGAMPGWTGLKLSSTAPGAAGASPSANEAGRPTTPLAPTSASAHPSAAASSRATPAGAPTSARTSATSHPAPEPAKTTAPAGPIALSVSPRSLTLSTRGPAAMTLSNPSGRPVTWSVSIPPGSHLAIWGPSSGQVGAHQSVRVYLMAQDSSGGNNDGNHHRAEVTVTVNPGDVRVTVTMP